MANSKIEIGPLRRGQINYVTKPFDTEELLARIRVALRHHGLRGGEPVQTLGAITIDQAAREVRKEGFLVTLTRKEYALVLELARYPGRVMTHEALLVAVWGETHRHDTEYLRVAVRALRRKLKHVPGGPKLIQNVPGVGYRLAATG